MAAPAATSVPTAAAPAPAERERRRIRVRVEGIVQGVGFRPFVYRLARELGLAGFVLNDEHGVVVEAEGDRERLERMLARIEADAPPLAEVERVDPRPVPALGERGFEIVASRGGGEPEALVAPDVATCDACLAELADPGDRRYRYPFTNCTDCGPRFTIVRGVPYDRPLTTMAGFEMCSECRVEYEDPLDRRFHAQPNACPRCGPRVRLLDAGGGDAEPRWRESADRLAAPADALAATAAALLAGRIVAIKGIGGYHLACRADRDDVVATLRARKHREEKPLAVIAPDLSSARGLVRLSAAEERLLGGRERPIVIARRRREAPVAAAVAPGCPDLGVMLPYSPLHHVLLGDCGVPLVMTSGNLSDEPIAFTDDDARERLGSIADLLCVHDRPIHVRTDDSVVRSLAPALGEAPILLRRSRGYAPASLALPLAAPPTLAVGAELKSTFCLARGTRAWVGQHVGDLKNFETLNAFERGIAHFERLFGVAPELVAHDLHPDYLSTSYALARDGLEPVAVQHHHAHLAAVLAEHGEAAEAVGAIFDGTGYGPDGTVWGGELLAGGIAASERVGSLLAVPLPGGDAAVREPWRLACAWLATALGEDHPAPPRALGEPISERRWGAVCELVRSGVSSPPTSSVGRLFDAVAALCAIRLRVAYEGQAAVELESIADLGERGAYPLPLIGAEGGADERLLLDARETVRAILDDLAKQLPLRLIAARFHNGLAAATADACTRQAEARGSDAVVLGGGVFQNRLLLERTAERLRSRRLRVLLAERLPPNDGGIAYGQAAVAAARSAIGRPDSDDRIEDHPPDPDDRIEDDPPAGAKQPRRRP